MTTPPKLSSATYLPPDVLPIPSTDINFFATIISDPQIVQVKQETSGKIFVTIIPVLLNVYLA